MTMMMFVAELIMLVRLATSVAKGTTFEVWCNGFVLLVLAFASTIIL